MVRDWGRGMRNEENANTAEFEKTPLCVDVVLSFRGGYEEANK